MSNGRKYKDDYSRETAINSWNRAKQDRKDNQEYLKELKRVIREKHGLGKTNKLF